MIPEMAVLREHVRDNPNAAMRNMLRLAAIILATPDEGSEAWRD
jgi:hypothetical protein